MYSLNYLEMKSNITFDQIPEVIGELLNKMENVEKILNNFYEVLEEKEADELISKEQVSKLLKCHPNTVENWSKKGKLTKYGKGRKVYFKRREVLSIPSI